MCRGDRRAARTEANRSTSAGNTRENVVQRNRPRARNVLRRDGDAERSDLAQRRFFVVVQEYVTQSLRAARAMMNAAKIDVADPARVDETPHRVDVTREENPLTRVGAKSRQLGDRARYAQEIHLHVGRNAHSI